MLAIEIKALRKYLGESQVEFAARFRVNQATVCRWEANGITHGPTKIAMEGVLNSLNLSKSVPQVSPLPAE